MNKVLVACAALSMSASVAFAGGPIKTADEEEPGMIVVEQVGGAGAGGVGGTGTVVAVVLGAALLAALAGGDGT